MKRSYAIVLSCACALVLALFGLSACGGGSNEDSSDSSSASSSASTQESADGNPTDETTEADAESLSSDEIRNVFEQIVANMTEFYKGTSEAGEELYYAGGADGENAIFAIVVPSLNQSAIFVGPVTVEEGTNKLTISDETTGGTISFNVSANDDGTLLFNMGEQSAPVTMSKCGSSDIVNMIADGIEAERAKNNANSEEQGEEPAEGQGEEGEQQ